MPLAGAPDADDLERQGVESIVGDPGLRDELTDDEARPLIDWGLAQVTLLARQAAAQASVEMMDASMRDLHRLMKRVNRLVGARAAGDTARVREELDRLARLSGEMYGEETAPVDSTRLDTFMEEQESLSNEEIITRLLALFAPPWDPRPPLTAPPAPDQLASPPEYEQLAPLPTPDQLAPPPEHGQLAPLPEHDRLPAPPEPGRLPGPPSYDRLSGPPDYDLLPHEGEETPT